MGIELRKWEHMATKQATTYDDYATIVQPVTPNGPHGWELVSVVPIPTFDMAIFYWKRKVPAHK